MSTHVLPLASVARPKIVEREDALLARCKAGERAALDEFLHRYRERVLNLAFQLVRDHHAAEDIAQEVLVRAFSQLHNFRGESQIFTWLYRITLNECRARTRRAKIHQTLNECDERASTRIEDETTHRLAVESALDELSEALRAILILREMHGLSYDEIAAILKIPSGTVRSRLHEARRQFQKIWEAL